MRGPEFVKKAFDGFEPCFDWNGKNQSALNPSIKSPTEILHGRAHIVHEVANPARAQDAYSQVASTSQHAEVSVRVCLDLVLSGDPVNNTR